MSAIARSWAPRGQTPRQRAIISHQPRLSVLGALAIAVGGQQVQLHTQIELGTVNGDVVLSFLQRLLRLHPGPLLLVWDSAGAHLRRSVLAFLNNCPRLERIVLPLYAPELNPVEYVWAQVTHALAGTAPRDLAALRQLLQRALARMRANPARLRACLQHAPLDWQRTGVK